MAKRKLEIFSEAAERIIERQPLTKYYEAMAALRELEKEDPEAAHTTQYLIYDTERKKSRWLKPCEEASYFSKVDEIEHRYPCTFANDLQFDGDYVYNPGCSRCKKRQSEHLCQWLPHTNNDDVLMRQYICLDEEGRQFGAIYKYNTFGGYKHIVAPIEYTGCGALEELYCNKQTQ